MEGGALGVGSEATDFHFSGVKSGTSGHDSYSEVGGKTVESGEWSVMWEIGIRIRIRGSDPELYGGANDPNDPPLPVFEKTQFGAHHASHGRADAYGRIADGGAGIVGNSVIRGQSDAAKCARMLQLSCNANLAPSLATGSGRPQSRRKRRG